MSRFSRAGTFEYARTDSGWEFRPNEASARRVATFHAVFLTLLAFVILQACGVGVVFLLVDSSTNEWFATIMSIGCVLTLIGSTPLLILWATHVFRKSLRDNWLTMRVVPGGSIQFGEETLVAAGRARHVVIRTVKESNGEGGASVFHCIDVELERECVVPIPIPRYGMWNTTVSDKRTAEVFGHALASALGVVIREPATDSTTQ